MSDNATIRLVRAVGDFFEHDRIPITVSVEPSHRGAGILSVLDRLEAQRIKEALSRGECACDFRTKLLGDGCQVCNPGYMNEGQTHWFCPACGATMPTEPHTPDCSAMEPGRREGED